MNIDRTVLWLLLLLVATAAGIVVALSRRATGAADSTVRTIPSAARRFADSLLIAAWFGLATGAIHVLLALINRYVRHRFLMVGPQMFWMTPLAYALIFLLIGAVPAMVAALPSRIDLRRRIIPLFAGLGVFGLLLPFPQLHKIAGALIATGVAVQIGRAMAMRLDWWLSVMRRTIVSGGFVLLVAGASIEAYPGVSERFALSRLPVAPDKAPNVLLIVLDTVRAQNLSVYGYPRATTPTLERLARESATFDFAMSTAPWTLKSHGTMFTGLYSEDVDGNFERPIAFRSAVLADEFSKRGYATGGFVANLLYTSRESGLAKGFAHYDDYRLSGRQLVLHSWIAQAAIVRSLINSRSIRDGWNALRAGLAVDSNQFNTRTYGRRTAETITTAFLDWQTEQGRPFFAFLNYFDAHAPFRPPRQFQTPFALPENEAQGLYDGSIAYIDSQLERLFAELRNRGLLDNTIVVITSDHGEQFKDHGLDEHANSLYTQVLHVPLMFRYPSHIPQGLRVSNVVTLRDLAVTLSEVAGLGVDFPGTSLARYWTAGASLAGSTVAAELSEVIRAEAGSPASFGPMQSVFDEQFHYIRRGDGAEQVFAYRDDRAEQFDLSGTNAGRERMPALRQLLDGEATRSARGR